MTETDPSKYSVIARCLQAASGALPADQPGKLCLINEDENDLMETIVEGNKLINEDYIASGVKKNTPAAYLYQELSQACTTTVLYGPVVNDYPAHGLLCERGKCSKMLLLQC